MPSKPKKQNPYVLPEDQRPREKLRRDPSGESLSDAELLAIVLNTGTEGCPVFELAIRLLGVFPSIDEFVSSNWLAMKERIDDWNGRNPQSPIRGIGDGKLLRISAAFLFEKRAKARRAAADFRQTIYDPANPGSLLPLFARIVEKEAEKEHFFVLPIDAKLRPICAPIEISQGTITQTPVHPREVYCEATRYRARAIVVAHNHPDGDPEPSEDDLSVTKRLAEAGRILGIKLLDHIVLGGASSFDSSGFTSIRTMRSDIFA